MTTLLAILVCAQAPEPRLNYETVAVPLSQICEDLTKQVGRKLRVHEDLAAEPVIIRFKDVAAKEALDKLAEAVSAEWVEGKGESLLIRTQKMQQKLEEAQYAARLELFQSRLEAIRKRVRERGAFGDKEATDLVLEFRRLANLPPEQQRQPGIQMLTQRIHESRPSARFAERLMALMDPAELAGASRDETLWLSNKPNSAQRPLRGYDSSWLAEFLQEHAAMIRAAKREGVEGLMYPPYDQEIGEGDFKLLVSVSPRGLDSTIADETGLILTRSNHGWAPISDAIQARIDRLALQHNPSEQPIRLSQAAKDFAALYQTRRPADNKSHQVAPELREMLLNPERVDPLAPVLSEVFLRTTDKNLVGYAPDSSYMWALSLMRQESFKPSFVLASLRAADFRVVEDDGWLTIAPKAPLFSLESRMPRPLLGEFIRRVDQERYVSIESAARLSLSATDRRLMLASEYAGSLLGFGAGEILNQMDILRLYGSLSADQKQDLAKIENRPLSYFTDYQQDLIQGLVMDTFLYYSRPTTDNPEEPKEYLGMFPCESFPDGLPKDTPVKLKIIDEGGYQMGLLSHGRLSESPSDFNGVAGYYAQMQRPDIFKWIPNQPLQSVTPSRNFTLHLELLPHELWRFARFLQATHKVGKPMSLDEFLASLSEEERTRFDEAAKKADASFKNLPDWFTEGSPNPPPRPPQ